MTGGTSWVGPIQRLRKERRMRTDAEKPSRNCADCRSFRIEDDR